MSVGPLTKASEVFVNATRFLHGDVSRLGSVREAVIISNR